MSVKLVGWMSRLVGTDGEMAFLQKMTGSAIDILSSVGADPRVCPFQIVCADIALYMIVC